MSLPFAWLGGAMCLAFWPVWVWFAKGTMDGSNDAAGLLAAATALLVVWRTRAEQAIPRTLALPAVLLAIYAVANGAGLPIATCALIAAVALAALGSAASLGRRLDPALLCLCLLALPLAASLQFYLGYPLRVLAGTLSVAMLRMSGVAVVRDGAILLYDGQLLAIDAPCSGVKMLWAGAYLACALAAGYRLAPLRTLAALAMAGAVIIGANAMRASALFYLESGLVRMPSWGHQAVGIACFVAGALGILLCVRAVQGVPR